MSIDVLAEIEQLNSEAGLNQMRVACESRIAIWKWVSNDIYHPSVLWFERNRLSKGRVLSKEPDEFPKQQVGFDEKGRVVLDQEFVMEDFSYLTLIKHLDSADFGVRFDIKRGKPELRWVWTLTYDRQDLPVLFEQMDAKHKVKTFQDRFEYDEKGRVIKIIEEWGNNQYDVLYDDMGLLAIETPTETGTWRVFERKDKKFSIAKAALVVEQALVNAVPQVVEEMGISEPACFVALVYEEGQDGNLPPIVGVGLESERLKLKQSNGEIWNPAEYSTFSTEREQIRDSELLSLCEKFENQIVREEKWSALTKVLDNVATRLMDVNWQAIIPVTDDFVVYSCDPRSSKFNLKKSVPASLLSRLKERKLLR